jgi:hypothetical protein
VIGRVEVDDRPRQITHGGGHDVTVFNEHPTATIYYGGPSVSSVSATGSIAPGAAVQLTTPVYLVTAPLTRGQVMIGRVTPAWGVGTLPQTVGAQDPDPVAAAASAARLLTQDGAAALPQRGTLNVISPLLVFDDSIGAVTDLALGSSPHFDGDPTAATQAAGDNSTKLATTAYADRIAQGVGAPNTRTADYTLVLADAGKSVEQNLGTATVVTVPTNASVAFPVGTIVEVLRYGAGAVAIAAAGGVTIRSRGGLLSIGNQYGAVSLRKRATDEWVLVGDLA